MRLNVCTFILTVSVLVGVAAFPPSAFGANYNWVGGTGDWSVPTNWNPGGVPACDDWVWVANGGTAGITGTAECAYAVYVESSGVSVLSGSLGVGNLLMLDYGGQFEQSGGAVSAFLEVIGDQGTGSYRHTNGNNTSQYLYVGNQHGSNGTYELSVGAVLSVGVSEAVGFQGGTGTFIQSGGINRITSMDVGGLFLGIQASSVGTYELSGSAELSARGQVIGYLGKGTFIQTGGKNTVTGEEGAMLILGNKDGSDGRYELSGNAELSAPGEVIGYLGTGTFIQTGGTNIVKNVPTVGDTVLTLGYLQGSQGEYELNGGTLTVEAAIFVGWEGTGTFTQTVGTCNTTDLYLGTWENSEGTYNLNGGNLNVADNVEVGLEGTGSFVMDGGTINGTTGNAEVCVYGSTGSLTGPGTFNITVTYESDKMYGTQGDEPVAVTFDPYCLTVGGAYNVDWTTPSNFAGGTVEDRLVSYTYDISFDGTWSSDFELALPYNQQWVNKWDVNEADLLILRETGPETYEQVPVEEIDTEDDIAYAVCDSFGRYAVAVPEGVIGFPVCCVPWHLGDLDHDCDVSLDDLYELADSWLQDDPSVDIFPIGGDGIANFTDFTVLANHWLECTVP